MSGSLALVLRRTGDAVGDLVQLAVTRKSRREALPGRSGLEQSNGVVLAPRAAVRTMFMRCAIDVVFACKRSSLSRVVSAFRRTLSPNGTGRVC